MNRNKSAAVNTLELLGGLIIMGMLIIIVLVIIQAQGKSTTKVMTKYTESLTTDFDNDGINDFYDESPCVAGEDLIIDKNDGKKYAFFADLPETNTDCKGISTVYELDLKIEDSTELNICVLPDRTCAKTLEENYKELRS